MSLYVLDSDILSLLQAGNPQVVARVANCARGELATTVITVEEQLRGWFSLVRRAKKSAQVSFAYDQLARSVSDLSKTVILSFSETAITTFSRLRKAKLGVSGNDLRIAAIVLEYKATLITRNVRDFELIPGLAIEDWAK